MSEDETIKTFIVEPELADKRLDVYLSEKMEDFSRTQIQNYVDSYLVKVNDIVGKSSYRLHVNDRIVFFVPKPVPVEINPEPYPLKIIYEDKDLIVLNKDAGVTVHPTPGHYTNTLVNYLLYHCKDLSGIGGVLRPGIVHRLDKDTTGLMVVAKNDKAHQGLSAQFKERQVTKIYNAIVKGKMEVEKGYIRKSIFRHPKQRNRMCASDNYAAGKQSLTYYETLELFADATFIKVKLFTGRTHQIRVHFSSIGHPLFGDVLYLKKKKSLDTFGLALVSKELGFIHPVTGESLYFTIDLPTHFDEILNRLKK